MAIRAAAARTQGKTQFVGLDVSERILHTAQRHISCAHQSFVRADAHYLPFRPAVFDALLCVAVVPYLQNLTQAAAEWRRVLRLGGVVVFTTPAAGGLSVHRLLTAAAAEHNITVPDPHAALGSETALHERATELRFTIEVIVKHSLPEPPHGTPEQAFRNVIDYGFAGNLTELPDQLRERIFASYRRGHLEAQRTQQGSQDWLFTRCRLP